MWEARASPVKWLGPKRFFESPISLNELPALDAVLISHDHYDHLGKRTIRQLVDLESARNAQWVTSTNVGKELVRCGVQKNKIAELDWTESVTLMKDVGTTLKVTALPTRHLSGRKLWDRCMSLWCSFALKGNHHRVYFGGDSGMWDGFVQISREHGPFDLTMLEIGAFDELWSSIHLGPDGAAKAFASMGGQGLLMPIHWGLFDLALHGWKQPIERLTELASITGFKIWAPEPGIPSEVVSGVELRSSWWTVYP